MRAIHRRVLLNLHSCELEKKKRYLYVRSKFLVVVRRI